MKHSHVLTLLGTFILQHLCIKLVTCNNSISNVLESCEPVTIAHRGASGYIPEHTLGAYALAITMGADYIEPDLVMTRDGQLVARHENQIGLSTNVENHLEFASRYRIQTIDGVQYSGWFTEDFTLEELKTLRAVERIPTIRPGNARMDEAFDVPTLQEIIHLVKSMESSERRVIGIYPEIKHPTHFQQIGLPMEQLLVSVLHQNGYYGPDAPVIIQSFEVSNLKELKNMTELPLVQLYASNQQRQPYDQILLGTNLTYGHMATTEGLAEVATYAYGVGPDKSYIIPRDENNRLSNVTDFVRNAHAVGLKVHPYTFRAENSFLPAEFRTEDASVDAVGNLSGEVQAFIDAGIDGLFVDQPDVSVRLRGPCSVERNVAATLITFNTYILIFLHLVHLLK